ncbi:MAG: hypothetical protein FD167_268 [bacterium]|nr:MAG: hypothetical protein FD167_268 [bacterium]
MYQTNLANPMWIHFETFYVLQQPTYMSKYPPGQGLVLALGQILTGYPIVGVWLSMALACAATCWMLQAWLPPRWALLGGLLMILKLGLFSYWSQSFWGGAVAAIGGAILLGALRRIIKQPKMFNALLFGLGLGILANSRPYEGLVFSLLAMVYLLIWMRGKHSPPFNILLKEIILPLLGLMLVIGTMMGYYNWLITGSPLILPHQLYENIYGTVSDFLWRKPRTTIQYNHEAFRKQYYEWYFFLYNTHQGLSNYINTCVLKIQHLSSFFLSLSFGLILCVLPLLRKNFWVWFAILNLIILIAGMLQALFSLPHYAAPGTCLVYFLVLQSMRRIYFLRWQNRAVGQLMVWAVPIYCVLLIFLPVILKVDPYMYVNAAYWEAPKAYFPTWMAKREEIISKVKQDKDNYLILIQYLPGERIHNEWVYNEADIDNAKVIWARSMSYEKNCELMKYFSNRKVIFLELGDEPDVIKKYYTIKGCE